MTKFLLKKRFSLSFLGDEWKECYLSFNAFTVTDVKEKLPAIAKVDEKNPENVGTGITQMVTLLQSKFVDGKGVNEKGEVVDINKEDLNELPVMVISRAVSFLSQLWAEEIPKP